MAKRATATRQKTDSRLRRSGAAHKRTTSGRSGTQASRGTSGSTRRRSTTGDQRQSGRRATGRAQDVETAQLEPTRGEAGDRLSPSRRRSSDESRRSRTSSRALAEDAEGAGGPDRSVGRERQGDELDERVMREGSNPRAAAETRER